MTRIQTGGGRVHPAAPTHVYAAAPLSATDAAWLGSKTRLTTAGGKGFQGQEATITAEGCEIGVYTKTGALSSSTALPEAGYAHKIGGQRKYDSTWHVYTAQPDAASWRTYHLANLKALPAWATAVFSDSVVLSYSQGGKPAKPPGFTVDYTLPEWLALEKANLDAWQAATGKRFLINGLTTQTVSALTPGVGMIENAYHSNRTSTATATSPNLPSAAEWLQTSQFLIDAQARGWTPWCYAKLFTQDPAVWDAWRRLFLPSMLLCDAGSLLAELGGKEGSPPPWVTREYDHAAWTPSIGAPTEPADLTRRDASGNYTRQHEHGWVIVNPSTTPTSTNLTTTAAAYPVPAQSGLILRETTTYQEVGG